ncbi:hypothetical protein GCM10023346_22700 [Arthrobacter gyeryongensis]|uniref:Uncharacterized protein n=1 Tax=Arthrobacter gyeryongensis TaxID=1650592 RepID=A0ABP9SGC1_9MICC
MTDSAAVEALEALRRQEEELIFTSFDHGDAWRLGSLLTSMAQEAGHAIGIDIRRPGLTASGLSSQEDHDLIVEGIRQHLTT